MSRTSTHARRSLVALAALAAAAALLAATPGAAGATGYGELAHFGSAGLAAGQFTATEEASAFGVDPTDNSVYVTDLPDENEEFRLQKFTPNAKGEYQYVAAVKFKPTDQEGPENPDTVEGVAVDPSLKRLYVLAAEVRGPGLKYDPEREAAAVLFAFSTEPSGGKLVPASGAGKHGVLVDELEMKPLSIKPSVPLLEPSGIAVDPTNHNIVILGEQDSTSNTRLVALQRITDEGAMLERYVDRTDYFEGEGATSPVVSSTGHVYVDAYDEIVEIPQNFTETGPPKAFARLASALDRLTELPGEPPAEYGGALSIAPEGTIYTRAGIEEQSPGQPQGAYFPGILALSSNGMQEGWTGGQSSGPGNENGPCQIDFASTPLIAAGKNHDVFLYENSPTIPRVIEFGPGGSGCPSASATPPAATVNGVPVAEGEPIAITNPVVLSAQLTHADATSVEWEFGDGTATTVTTPQYQTPEITHQFTTTGELTVTAHIHTDDLAAPELVEHSKVHIVN
jgi:hypothetical protein